MIHPKDMTKEELLARLQDLSNANNNLYLKIRDYEAGFKPVETDLRTQLATKEQEWLQALERGASAVHDAMQALQRVAELEAALENVGNMAYTALHIDRDIRDRNQGELEHAAMLILDEVNEARRSLESEGHDGS